MSALRPEGLSRTHGPVVSNHKDSIDEMASALLDDTTSVYQAEVRQNTRRRFCHNSPVAPHLKEISSLRGVSQGMSGKKSSTLMAAENVPAQSPAVSHHKISRAPEAEKMSPSSLSEPTKLGSEVVAPEKKQPAQYGSPVRVVRVLPRSHTAHMNDVQPKSARLPPSSSLAIGQLEGRPHVGQFSKVNAVDINRKVEQLLEATAALKGVSKGRGNSSQPSMLNRIKSNKVVAKFSGVFSERFHHKAKGSKVDGKTKAAAKGSPADPTRGGALPLIGHSPIPAVELRLNEGKNLCKSKVKERFGGDLNVRRKPVAGEGRSLRTSQSLDDPFSDAHQIRRSPTRFEARLMETPMTKKYESCISLACSDPFELERVMDTSVDGILPFSPLASSTPRDRRLAVGIDESPLRPESDAKVDAVLTSISESSPILPSRHQTPSDDESPTMKINKATVSCRGDELAARDTCDDPFTRLDSPEIENLSASRGRKTPRSETQALRGLIGAPVLPFSPWGRKKHPSPSKSELEELERQLRKYAPGVFGTTTEEDELAVGYESTKVVRALRPRDPNSLGRRSGSASQGHAGDSGCASLQYFKSHQRSTTGITRNSRSLGHLNGSQAQLGSAAASDIDELQWDASAFNFGQRHQHGPAEAH